MLVGGSDEKGWGRGQRVLTAGATIRPQPGGGEVWERRWGKIPKGQGRHSIKRMATGKLSGGNRNGKLLKKQRQEVKKFLPSSGKGQKD